MFPTSLSDISLIQWIAYTNKLQPLDEELKQVTELPECKRKQILITKNFVDRAFESALFFGIDPGTYVDDMLKQYEDFCSLLNDFKPQTIESPTVESMLFGQFIDAKMLLQAAKDRNKWELIQYIIVIFFITDPVKYNPEWLNEKSTEFESTGEMKMHAVISYSHWWEELNKIINERYTVFQDSGDDESENMKIHMERWGWINFLKSIAKTKVFDIPGSGMNSIDCARTAKMDDVLVWSSEEKEYNLAVMRDMKK